MILLFEDDSKSPVSIMLTRMFGDKVRFSAGNEYLYRVYSEIRKTTDEPILIFVDTVPDNNKTIEIYDDLVFAAYEDGQTFVYPIPCIEYFVIKSLLRMQLVTDRLSKVNKFMLSLNGTNISYSEKSYEKFCKAVLNGEIGRCFTNMNSTKNHLYGKFYITECGCENVFRSKCLNKDVSNKDVYLARELPIIPEGTPIYEVIKDSNLFVKCSTSAFNSIIESIYSAMFKSLDCSFDITYF